LSTLAACLSAAAAVAPIEISSRAVIKVSARRKKKKKKKMDSQTERQLFK
jgi:hypothetical protein